MTEDEVCTELGLWGQRGGEPGLQRSGLRHAGPWGHPVSQGPRRSRVGDLPAGLLTWAWAACSSRPARSLAAASSSSCSRSPAASASRARARDPRASFALVSSCSSS